MIKSANEKYIDIETDVNVKQLLINTKTENCQAKIIGVLEQINAQEDPDEALVKLQDALLYLEKIKLIDARNNKSSYDSQKLLNKPAQKYLQKIIHNHFAAKEYDDFRLEDHEVLGVAENFYRSFKHQENKHWALDDISKILTTIAHSIKTKKIIADDEKFESTINFE